MFESTHLPSRCLDYESLHKAAFWRSRRDNENFVWRSPHDRLSEARRDAVNVIFLALLNQIRCKKICIVWRRKERALPLRRSSGAGCAKPSAIHHICRELNKPVNIPPPGARFGSLLARKIKMHAVFTEDRKRRAKLLDLGYLLFRHCDLPVMPERPARCYAMQIWSRTTHLTLRHYRIEK